MRTTRHNEVWACSLKLYASKGQDHVQVFWKHSKCFGNISQLETRPLIGWPSESTNHRPGFQLTYVSNCLMFPIDLHMIRPLNPKNILKGLISVPQNIIRLNIHPWGTTCSPISSWSKFSLVTMFAIDFFVFSIENGVVSQLIFASSTSCTFFVKFSSFARDSLSTENSTSTPWTIFLRIFGFDDWSVWNIIQI